MKIDKLKGNYSVITIELVANMLPDKNKTIREAKAALLIDKFSRTEGIYGRLRRTIKYPHRHSIDAFRISPSVVDLRRKELADQKRIQKFVGTSIYTTLKKLIKGELK